MPMATAWPAMPSTGEAILFSCTAVFMVACALGVLFFKKAAHCAISMVGVMLGLAVLYFAQGAPFLGSVQVIVYTGAIMMLFLFVIMMIGISASDDYTRQRRGNIVASVVLGLGMMVVVAGVVLKANRPDYVGFDQEAAYTDSPVQDLAVVLFSNHWFTMELAGMLLVTAAIAAMLLTHTDALRPKLDQKRTAEAKMQAFKEQGRRIGQLPTPGVYANSNAVDVPAIDGATYQPLEDSVSRVLRVKGLHRPLGMVEPAVAQSLQLVRMGDIDHSPLFGKEASERVQPSQAWGMAGNAAPTGLNQPMAPEPGAPALVNDEDDALHAGTQPAAEAEPAVTDVPEHGATDAEVAKAEKASDEGADVRDTPAPDTAPAGDADTSKEDDK